MTYPGWRMTPPRPAAPFLSRVFAVTLGVIVVLLIMTLLSSADNLASSPPWRFDHPYRGHLVVHEVSASWAECSKRGAHADACAWTKNGSCYIISPMNLSRAERTSIVRHERAHCNGWPADHPP